MKLGSMSTPYIILISFWYEYVKKEYLCLFDQKIHTISDLIHIIAPNCLNL